MIEPVGGIQPANGLQNLNRLKLHNRVNLASTIPRPRQASESSFNTNKQGLFYCSELPTKEHDAQDQEEEDAIMELEYQRLVSIMAKRSCSG